MVQAYIQKDLFLNVYVPKIYNHCLMSSSCCIKKKKKPLGQQTPMCLYHKRYRPTDRNKYNSLWQTVFRKYKI